jgi:tRNA (cytosine34-C5)-methyltransferase
MSRNLNFIRVFFSRNEFSTVLREPLPITFRFNTSKFAFQAVQAAKEEAYHLLHPSLAIQDDYGCIIPPPKELEWVDGWQLNVERVALRRSKVGYLQELRQWLVHNTKT